MRVNVPAFNLLFSRLSVGFSNERFKVLLMSFHTAGLNAGRTRPPVAPNLLCCHLSAVGWLIKEMERPKIIFRNGAVCFHIPSLRSWYQELPITHKGKMLCVVKTLMLKQVYVRVCVCVCDAELTYLDRAAPVWECRPPSSVSSASSSSEAKTASGPASSAHWHLCQSRPLQPKWDI